MCSVTLGVSGADAEENAPGANMHNIQDHPLSTLCAMVEIDKNAWWRDMLVSDELTAIRVGYYTAGQARELKRGPFVLKTNEQLRWR